MITGSDEYLAPYREAVVTLGGPDPADRRADEGQFDPAGPGGLSCHTGRTAIGGNGPGHRDTSQQGASMPSRPWR
ncbi:MAG: hypothetical protein IPM88_11955 [Nitrospira sp.]|nr:hypothetical protein [Nitrospira sp.]